MEIKVIGSHNLILSGGYFNLHKKDEITSIKNTLVAKGAEYFLRTLFRNESVLPGTLYLGLTNATYAFDTATLLAIASGEPVGNGYARLPLIRNTTDWQVSEINGAFCARSKIVSFSASANWNTPWQRMFLCDAANGTTGNVFSLSGPAPSPEIVLSGRAPSVSYEYWLRG